jgi:hypothetical protein
VVGRRWSAVVRRIFACCPASEFTTINREEKSPRAFERNAVSTTATEHLTVELWPEGLNAEPAPGRVVSLAPGVLCLATQAPPAPGTRFVAKFSIRGEFPIVVGCQARWRLERSAGEFWISATFLTLDERDWTLLYDAWCLQPRNAGARAAHSPSLAATG